MRRLEVQVISYETLVLIWTLLQRQFGMSAEQAAQFMARVFGL